MKSLGKLLFNGLAIALFLTSCTTEKRVYMSGYHTEWHKSKHNPDMQDLASNDNEKQTKKNQTVIFLESANETNTFDNSVASTVTYDNITASLDNTPVIIPTHKTVAFDNKNNTVYKNTKYASETKTIIPNKKAFKNKLKELKVNSSSDDDSDDLALRILGWIIWAIGLLIILFASIIGGLLICALGILFMVLGKKKETSSSSDNKSEYLDVVYLKNGGVIKGMIIEQTPNVQIKIQSKDGSIFVYKMEEVEKMTKELSK